MTIWIDPPAWPAHDRLWSHLISDSSVEELHAFAARAGVPERGFEGDHYDIPQERYAAAVALGAQVTATANIVRLLQDSGLRLRKRKGERGIARVLGVSFPDGSRADVDFVRGTRPTPDAATFAATVYVRDAADNWLLVWSRRRQEWSAPGGWREPGETVVETACRETREETGVVLDPSRLRPVAYERFHPLPDGAPWPVPGGLFLAVFQAEVAGVTPSVIGLTDEPATWCTRADALAKIETAWWAPLARAVLSW